MTDTKQLPNGRRSLVEKFILGIVSVWCVSISAAQLNIHLRQAAIEATTATQADLKLYTTKTELAVQFQDIYEKQRDAQAWRLRHTEGHAK
jgi:hypothetical protein